MRLNRFIAMHTGIARRKADDLINAGKVVVNRKIANPGYIVTANDVVLVNGKKIERKQITKETVLFNKPVGFVCGRDGQGSPTIYDLLPKRMASLNIAGRLDKDSNGLVVLTNDGTLLQELTHPSNEKEKVYIVQIDKPLIDGAIAQFARGVPIGDERESKMSVLPTTEDEVTYEVVIHEGRNRQIRRSFEALGYKVITLKRTKLGQYELGDLAEKQYRLAERESNKPII